MMNPSRVMPLCDFLIALSPRSPMRLVIVVALPRGLSEARADAVEIDAAGGAVEVHPHQERLAAQLRLRQRAPEAAVVASITIVAHDEVLALGHRPLAHAVAREHRAVDLQHLVARAAAEVLGQQAGTGHLPAAAL